MATVDKRLKVWKTDRFQIGGPNLIDWLNGEALQSFTCGA